MHRFHKVRAPNPLNIFTKQFIQQSYYLSKRRHEFGVIICNSKKRLKLSKVAKLWRLLIYFAFCRVGFQAIVGDNMAQILDLWKAKCILFVLVYKPVLYNY